MRDEEAARLLDLLEAGDLPPEGDEAGRAALGEAGQGLRLLEAHAEVPEPGPLYWRRFAAQVQDALPRVRRTPAGRWWVAAAAAALAVGVTLSRAPGPTGGPLWHALPEDDAAFLVLSGLGDEVAALEPEAACAVEECVLDLDAVESDRLASLLREEMQGREL